MLLMYMVPNVICWCTDCRMLPQVLSGPEHIALASSTPCSATSPHGQTPCEVVGAQDAPSWSGPIPTEGGGGYMVQEWLLPPASPSSCSPLLACAPKSPYGQCMGPPSHPGHDLMRGEHLWFGARGHTAACCLNVIGNMTAGTKAPRAHGVVVSHPLRMRKALGSIPSVSISAVFCHDAQPPLCLAADMRILRMQDHLRVLAAVAFA